MYRAPYIQKSQSAKWLPTFLNAFMLKPPLCILGIVTTINIWMHSNCKNDFYRGTCFFILFLLFIFIDLFETGTMYKVQLITWSKKINCTRL